MASASGIRMGKVFVEIGADPAKFFAALQGVQKRIGSLGSAMTSFGKRMAGVGAAVTAPLGLAARQFAQFDDAIRATAAVSGASGAALQSLNDRARDLGATTSFTAVEVANLMTELGRAGFKPDQINAMTGAVLDLARATGTDATRASGIMAATLRQFGLGADEATRAADVLTATANNTFNTVDSLGESLKYAGPVAKSLGMSLEDTAAILGVLGNVGIQGSEAGTALRRLSVISAGAGEKLQELFGVSNVDAAGNMKPLVDILDEINTVTASMPVAERTKRMAEAFGLLGITSANVLSQSAGGVRALSETLREAQGTAARTAKEMDAGLGGSIRIMLSAIEGTALAIGDSLAPSLQSVMKGIEDTAGGITKFVKNNQELVLTIAKGVAIFAGVAAAIYGIGGALTFLSTVFIAIPVSVLAAAASLATFVLSTVAAGISSAMSAATIATAWAGPALVSVLAFVRSAVVSLATYVWSCAAAAAATVLDAAAVAAGWVSAALPGVMAFVVGAVSGIASYVASCAVAVATSVASAAAVAAAWLAPLAPILAIGAAVAGAGMLVYQFGGQIKSAMAGIGGVVGEAAGAIGGGFNAAVSDGAVVLGDLASTATTTFNGIYAAIAEGDLAGAMDVLWAGLYAGWLRGVEGLMGAVDPWVSLFQNTFTYLSTAVLNIWDMMFTGIAQAAVTFMAPILGIVDNIVNSVMAAFDTMVAAVRKSWNWVQSLIKSGYDLKKENEKVDNEMAARRRQREIDRPGTAGRQRQAEEQGRMMGEDSARRQADRTAQADATAAEREARNASNADARREDRQAAEANVANMSGGKRETRARNDQFSQLLKDIEGATTMDALRSMYEEFDALSSNGRLTSAQTATLETALEDAQERISKGMSSMGGSSPSEQIRAGAGAAAGEAAQSQAEVAGTFSAMAIGGMGVGSSLAQKQLDQLTKIEQNTRVGDEGAVAA